MPNNNIPQGYKQTELGTIPEDWEIVCLKDVAKVNGRIGFRGYTVADLVDAGQGAYVIGGKHISGSIVDLSEAEYISWTKYYESPEIMVQCGDIVMAQRGTLGKNALIDHEIGPATINPSLVLINHIKCNNLYLNYWLQSEQANNAICSLNCQTSIPMITQWQIEHIPIALSIHKKEQHAIAEALSDVDALIAALDKKITKKRLVKQGAMQQLLTGKKRLPNFSEKRISKKLGEISRIKTGKRNGDEQVKNGKYPFFVRSNVIARIDSYSFDGEAILVPGEGGIGVIFHYVNGKFDYHQRVYKISDFVDTICGKYVYYYMQRYFGEYALSLSVKATVDSLRLPTFEEFSITLPNNIEEQQAIATILSDMDKEIADLEACRDKYKFIKSGMMQKLLTGQIRLPF